MAAFNFLKSYLPQILNGPFLNTFFFKGCSKMMSPQNLSSFITIFSYDKLQHTFWYLDDASHHKPIYKQMKEWTNKRCILVSVY